jgi:hypothetical protein
MNDNLELRFLLSAGIRERQPRWLVSNAKSEFVLGSWRSRTLVPLSAFLELLPFSLQLPLPDCWRNFWQSRASPVEGGRFFVKDEQLVNQ